MPRNWPSSTHRHRYFRSPKDEKIRRIEDKYTSILQEDAFGKIKPLNNLAKLLIRAELYDKATHILDVALKRNLDFGSDVTCLRTRGLLFFRQSNIDKGNDFYNRSFDLSDNPFTRQEYYYELGRALRLNKQFIGAIKHLTIALEIQDGRILKEQIEVELDKANTKSNL